MSSSSDDPGKIPRARELRRKQTTSEGLLWSLLRARQIGGLKFRRQHPIGPFFADFACFEHRLVVEIDGGYHDATTATDLARESYLKNSGWSVLRFSDKDVEEDAEVVAKAIAAHLGVDFDFRPRKRTGSGMKHDGVSPLPGNSQARFRPSRREGEE